MKVLLLPYVPYLLTFTVFGAPSGSYADWREQVWPPALAIQDSIAGPNADPDADQLANFSEYALGLDPRSPSRQPISVVSWPGSSGDFTLRLRSANGAREASLQVAWSSSVSANPIWQTSDGVAMSETVLDDGASSSEVEIRLAAAAAGSAAFVRVEARPTVTPPASLGYVWFEGEGAFGGESDPGLSNNRMNWLNPGQSLERTITIPEPGAYQLWVRRFWNPQAVRWRVGAGDAWKGILRDTSLVDLVMLSDDPGRRVGWFNAGPVELTAGSKTFRLEVPSSSTGITAYDCFILIHEPFTPRGKLKPDDPLIAEQAGWFSFQPEVDPFTHSPIDLRELNERTAGDGGWIRAQGEEFVHDETGKAVRFWAVNAGSGIAGFAKSEVDTLARMLAKRGVNLVRYHGTVYAGSGSKFGTIDTTKIDRLHYFVAALKREGIYTSISIYFPLWVSLGASNPEFPGYTGGHPFALLYFNDSFQAIYRSWWEGLLTPVNPHTGLALKDDPAVAMLEIINEDSTLFWTFDPHEGSSGNIPDRQRALLEKQFGDWLLARHAPLSLSEIRSQVWGGTSSSQDDFANGRVGFRGLWNIVNDRNRRDQDTAEFLTDLMRRFYQDTYSYLKAGLGYGGLVYASNWKTASAQYLDPLDKYANAVGDFFDRHGYLGALHEGADASWSVKSGQTYDDRAAVSYQPPSGAGENFDNPIFDLNYDERPSTISEVNWPRPNRYRADMIFLGAAYGALQGTDALFWFAVGSPSWDTLPGKFSIQTPVVQAQFPAAALLYRQRLVQAGPKVVDIELDVQDLYNLKGTPVPAPQNFDQLRGDDIPPGGVITNASAIDTLAFTVGRVGVRFVTNGAPQSEVTDLSPYIDRTNRISRSVSGELTWDYGRGLATVHAPSAQGATGFLLDAGSIDLPDCTVTSSMEYGSILLVALDRQPIAVSSKLLLQAMSEEQPFRWETSAPTGPRTIVDGGEAPVMVRNLAGTVSLKRTDVDSLTISPLDANGYRIPGATFTGGTITLQPNRFYYLIEK
jgi:hypothetical protein